MAPKSDKNRAIPGVTRLVTAVGVKSSWVSADRAVKVLASVSVIFDS